MPSMRLLVWGNSIQQSRLAHPCLWEQSCSWLLISEWGASLDAAVHWTVSRNRTNKMIWISRVTVTMTIMVWVVKMVNSHLDCTHIWFLKLFCILGARFHVRLLWNQFSGMEKECTVHIWFSGCPRKRMIVHAIGKRNLARDLDAGNVAMLTESKHRNVFC